jgi:hypothetical protein
MIEIVSRLEKVGLKRLNLAQTIHHNSTEINDIEWVRVGCDEGSFVLVRAGR